jgi:4-hydroxybenzoate polyprenyltransferase
MSSVSQQRATVTNPEDTAGNFSLSRFSAVLGDIKFAHTIFALPFALLAAHLAFLATGGYRIVTLAEILICMITARTAAMSFNRWLDRDIDSINPRTIDRSIPSGRARPVDAITITYICSVIFIATCWFLGKLPFILSIPTIAFLLGYSAAKRFTILTHIWLGVALAISPMGAWIAITGKWSWIPAILSVAVIFWVAGFDVIYSLQDIEFDRQNKIFSIPALNGETRAIWIARAMHFVSMIALGVFGYAIKIGWPYWVALGIVLILLLIEHSIAKPGDNSRIGIAFFTVNGVISIILYLSVLLASSAGLIELPLIN